MIHLVLFPKNHWWVRSLSDMPTLKRKPPFQTKASFRWNSANRMQNPHGNNTRINLDFNERKITLPWLKHVETSLQNIYVIVLTALVLRRILFPYDVGDIFDENLIRACPQTQLNDLQFFTCWVYIPTALDTVAGQEWVVGQERNNQYI